MQIDNSTENDDLQTLLEDIKFDLRGYVRNRFNYFKLKSYEKGSVLGSFIAYSFMLFFLVFNLFFLLLLVLGFFLSDCLGNFAAGFGILALIAILLIAICLSNAKRIRRKVADLIVSVIKKVESDEE